MCQSFKLGPLSWPRSNQIEWFCAGSDFKLFILVFLALFPGCGSLSRESAEVPGESEKSCVSRGTWMYFDFFI